MSNRSTLPPFSELFQDMAAAAGRQLDRRLAGFFSPSARLDLAQHLVRRLAETTAPVLNLKFSVFGALREPLFFEMPTNVQTHPLYPAFIDHVQQRGLTALGCEFPVLEELWQHLIDFWLEAAVELGQRLQADFQDIQATFWAGQDPGQVIAIRAGLSDVHQGGRTVMGLTFASGLKLIYKPRPVALEKTWFDLLDWLNRQGQFLPLQTIRVLPRPHYGWAEYVPETPCPEEGAVRRYYERAGMLLCLLYMMQGTDMHGENIRGCGEQPVLVDLETLFQPQSRWQGQLLAPTRFYETVLGSHFLPAWTGQPAADGSAMGGQPAWLNDAAVAPEDYLAPFEAGFEQMYRFWLAQKEFLAGPESPLARFAGQRVRPIFRDTAVYQRIVQRSLQPELLRRPEDRAAELAKLLAIQASDRLKTYLKPRCQAEILAAGQLDIPCFEADTSGTDLSLETRQSLAGYFSLPAMEQVQQRIRRLSEDDLDRQRYWLRGTFEFRRQARGRGLAAGETGPRPEEPKSSPPTDNGVKLATAASPPSPPEGGTLALSPPFGGSGGLNLMPLPPTDQEPARGKILELAETALELAEQINRTAATGPHGGVAWTIPEALPGGDRFYRFRPADYFLYEGNPGIALFLAAAARVFADRRSKALALAALEPLQCRLDDLWIPPRTSIGGASGLGGLVYALVKIGDFLGEPSPLEIARRIALQLTPERIAGDEKFDLYDGAAGAILGLLSLYRATADPAILDLAARCGGHLLSRRSLDDAGRLAWRTLGGNIISGMAHGTAGLAYSLIRLFEATGQPEFQDAAVEAIAVERTLFSPEAGNWRAFGSPPERPEFWVSFCHGAPGIGLARLGGLTGFDTADIRAEIEMALQTTLLVEPNGVDFLCCGNFGRNEFILEAGLRLHRLELIATAANQAVEALKRREKTGNFRLFETLPPTIRHPGFFQGTAGIGYTLLRLAFPGVLPCVLLWD